MRKYFEIGFQSTAFMDRAIISRVRAACRMTTAELKASVKAGNGRAKLPVCDELVQDIRVRLWEGRGWGLNDIDLRITYITLV